MVDISLLSDEELLLMHETATKNISKYNNIQMSKKIQLNSL